MERKLGRRGRLEGADVSKHTWRFARIGGFDQVELTTGEDLLHLGELDQKLWVALACPVKHIEFDERTLDLIDTDRDGRVRARELIAAAEWAGKMLTDPEVLAKSSGTLALDAIDDEHEDGKNVLASAKAVLASIDKADADSISVGDTANAIDAFNRRTFNGDGVVTADAAADDRGQKLVADVLACTVPATDKSGKPGITTETVSAFFDEIAAHAAWLAAGEADPLARPFPGAAEAWTAVSAVRAKADDFFARTKVAAFDARSIDAVNGEQAEYAAIAAKDLDATATEMRHFPLARVSPDGALPLDRGTNPAWRAELAALRDKAIVPALGPRSVLTEADWHSLLAKLEGYGAWYAQKRGASVEALGAERVKELATSSGRADLEALFAKEAEAAPLAHAIESVERLVRYCRDLLKLANNFVSFRDFYSRKEPATFQVGTLYVDQRACELCISVADAPKHATMAPLASAYLLYCDLKNAKGETRSIAAAMTNGDVDNLMVGRNGVFYDRKGLDWDATVTRLVENPISIRQAFWAPYKKVLRLIEETVAKRAAEAEAHATKGLESTATGGEDEKEGPKIDIGTVAALGVAVGGITAALGALFAALFGLGLWMPLGFLGVMLAISGPSMAIAWLKLRKRNLGPLLDANGWAINAQAKLNIPFGASLTKVAAIPAGAERSLVDPFEEKHRPWGLYVFLLAVLVLAGGWYVGKLDRVLPKRARSTTVLGTNAPAHVPPPPVPSGSAAPAPKK
jgi:hypothetical protein